VVLGVLALVMLPHASAPPASAPPASAPPASAPPASAPAGASCITDWASGPRSNCGPYSFPPVTASNGYTTYVGIDGWACGTVTAGDHSGPDCGPTRLAAANPGHWTVTTTQPAGHTGVLMYPSASQLYSDPVIARMSEIRSSYAESMPHTPGTIAWAAYDMFLNHTGPAGEVMIHTEVVHGCPACSAFVGRARFAGMGWTLRRYGEEWIWTPDKYRTSGTVDILAMLKWMIARRHLARTATLGSVGYGWEVCSTGGVAERFTVSQFMLRTRPAGL
jgi:hypothetical protein